MYIGEISFTLLPDIGFAMRHSRMHYNACYGNNNKMCVEVAYLNSGAINLSIDGAKLYAPERSVVVLFRHLPIATETVGEVLHSHDTALGEFKDLKFTLGSDDSATNGFGMKIPFVTMPSAMTEKIGIELRRIAYDMKDERYDRGFYSSIAFVNILRMLADIYENEKPNALKATEKNITKITEYIENNIDKAITVSEISACIGKSPNYTGQLFKKHFGMTAKEYINLLKMKKVSVLIKEQNRGFSDACTAVSLCDASYGYRLFKKYIGLTPGEFVNTNSMGDRM